MSDTEVSADLTRPFRTGLASGVLELLAGIVCMLAVAWRKRPIA